jgi:hypothetical protein
VSLQIADLPPPPGPKHAEASFSLFLRNMVAGKRNTNTQIRHPEGTMRGIASIVLTVSVCIIIIYSVA